MNDFNESDGLSSLAQTARSKQLNTARNILLFIGILTIAVNAFFVAMAKSMVDSQMEAELRKPQYRGLVIDHEEVNLIKEESVRSTQLVGSIALAIGVLYVIFAIFVKKYPVPITITSLVLYIGCAAVFGVLDPSTLARGWLIKILIVVGLFKAIQAALAYERERQHPSQVSDEFASPEVDTI